MRSAAMLVRITALLAATLHLASAEEDVAILVPPKNGYGYGYGYANAMQIVNPYCNGKGECPGGCNENARGTLSGDGECCACYDKPPPPPGVTDMDGIREANGKCMFGSGNPTLEMQANPKGLNKKFRFYFDNLDDESTLDDCENTCKKDQECTGYNLWKPKDSTGFHFAKCILYGKGIFKRGVAKRKRFTQSEWHEELAKGTVGEHGNRKYFHDVENWVDLQAIRRATTTKKQKDGNINGWIGIGNDDDDDANLQPEIVAAKATVTTNKKQEQKIDASWTCHKICAQQDCASCNHQNPWTCHKKEASLLASATTTAASDSGVTASTVFAFAGGLFMGAIATALVAKKMHGRAAVEYARVTEEEPLQPGMSDV